MPEPFLGSLSGIWAPLAALTLWAAVHSLLAGLPAKRLAMDRLGDDYAWYRLGYSLFATVTFAPLWLWLELGWDTVVYAVPMPWALAMAAGQLIFVVAFLLTFRHFDGLEFVGLRQVFSRARGAYTACLEEDPGCAPPLADTGVYGVSRHPMYLAGLGLLALRPVVTVGGLAFFAWVAAYLYAGSVFEEWRLVDTYGAAYERYRERVSRIIPWKLLAKPFTRNDT